MIKPIKINGKIITPQKAIISPILGSKNVLTNSRWEFVELWLKKEKLDDALYYWNQSKEFNNASNGLNIQSSPLLHYYSFMNASKALLSSKSIVFNHYHGVTHHSPSISTRINLNNEGIKIKSNGILPSLSNYFGETETNNTHTLQELFFNLPYIHRTYCLSYKSQTDMFIPLKEVSYVHDSTNNDVYLRAILSNNFSSQHVVNRLPATFILEKKEGNKYFIRSVQTISVVSPTRLTQIEKNALKNLNKDLRQDLQCINGAHTLWYLKSNVSGPNKLNRSSTTLALGAMHRLSELCRYKPLELNSFLSSQKNWLLSEFIQQSPEQFLDQIASEITGYQFLQPNIRTAT